MLIKSTARGRFELLPYWSNFAFASLVAYGVHLGHSLLSSLKFCAWMIKGQRKGIFLIDLFKFIYMFRAGFFALEIAIRGRNPVWFINLDKTSSLFVKFPALECGEFWVVENWIRGMISNYFIIKKSLSKTTNKPFPAWNRKTFLKSSSFSHWGFTRHSWPRLVFVSNVMRSYGPCHEAHRLKIPSLGIVDTNTPHSLVAIAIPGNDEAATALIFYNSLVSTFILYMKYSFIHNWYMGCLNEKQFSFAKWWRVFPSQKYGDLRPNILNFHFDQLRYMISCFETQFLQDIWQTRSIEAVRSLSKHKVNIIRSSILNFYKSRAKFFKSLKATWTVTALGMAFLRPRLRRWFAKGDIRRASKYSPAKEKNLEMLLRLPRWKRRFFLRIARRLRRSRQPSKSYLFFYKFFGLACLFSFFKTNFLFSRRFVRAVKLNRWWTRSHVRFPWFKHGLQNRQFEPTTYRNVYLRSRVRSNFRNKFAPMSLTSPSKPRFGFGQYRFTHQFPKEWSRYLWLGAYVSSLGARSSGLFSSRPHLTSRRARPHFHNFTAQPVRMLNFLQLSLRKFLVPQASPKHPLRSFFFASLPQSSGVPRKFRLNQKRLFLWADQRMKHLLSLDHFDFFSNNYFHYKVKANIYKRLFNRPRFAIKSLKSKSYFFFKYA